MLVTRTPGFNGSTAMPHFLQCGPSNTPGVLTGAKASAGLPWTTRSVLPAEDAPGCATASLTAPGSPAAAAVAAADACGVGSVFVRFVGRGSAFVRGGGRGSASSLPVAAGGAIPTGFPNKVSCTIAPVSRNANETARN